MKRCPYCFEEIPSNSLSKEKLSQQNALQCPNCSQFIIDKLIEVDYPAVDKKRCIYCGKNILNEAKICRYCYKWLDELDQDISNSE